MRLPTRTNDRPEATRQAHRIAVARGDMPADVVITGGQLANVYSGEIYAADVAIIDGCIAGLGSYAGRERIDASGLFIAPGFIDAHIHLESSMLVPAEFARVVVPLGTTAVIADPHEIANVLGIAGIDYMLASTEDLPLSVFFMLPSCVPPTTLETAGARLGASDLGGLIDHPRVLGLAEMMNYPGVLGAAHGVGSELPDPFMTLLPRPPRDPGAAPDGPGPGRRRPVQDRPSARRRLSVVPHRPDPARGRVGATVPHANVSRSLVPAPWACSPYLGAVLPRFGFLRRHRASAHRASAMWHDPCLANRSEWGGGDGGEVDVVAKLEGVFGSSGWSDYRDGALSPTSALPGQCGIRLAAPLAP